MLPSTSSPVESASTPTSLTDTLSCSPEYLGHKKAVHVADLQKENFHIPAKVSFGICDSQDNHEEGSSSMPPPDLCSDKGQQHSSDLHRPSSRSSEEDVEDTIAQAVCDTRYVTRLSQIEDVEQNVIEESGALGTSSVIRSELYENQSDMTTDGAPFNSNSSLPDLCDTRRGSHSKVIVENYNTGNAVQSSSSIDLEAETEASTADMGENFVVSNVDSQCDENEPVACCSNSGEEFVEVDQMAETSDENNLDNRLLESDYIGCEGIEEKISPDSAGQDESGMQGISESGCGNVTDDIEDSASNDAAECSGPVEDYLIHDNQQISLVACGITHCDPSFQQDVEMDDVSEEEHGIDLIRHNLRHSSHPMFLKWPCLLYITEEHLPSFSIDSHGKHIGSEAASMYLTSSESHQPSQLTEEEQVKIAKRMGLITHLPCGIYDGSKKSGECVICMIDFTVGDRVRYLPCMHTYHTECIDDWLMRSFTCPSCLEPVDAALLNSYGTS